MLTIYKASAGSGKTYTLTYRYIKMLLGYKDPATGQYILETRPRDRHRNILAVTFSIKATEEMKQRIIHELAVLGRLEPGWTEESPYMNDLVKEFRSTPEKIREAAATAMRQLMFDFNFFQVLTIDSFFQTILRTFAREADISGNYEIDLDNDRAIKEGVSRMFQSLSNRPNSDDSKRVVNWILEYLMERLREGKTEQLFNQNSDYYQKFIKFIDHVSNDEFQQVYASLMEFLSDPKRLTNLRKAINQAIETYAKTAENDIRRAIETVENLGGTKAVSIDSRKFGTIATRLRTNKISNPLSENELKRLNGEETIFLTKAKNPDLSLQDLYCQALRSIDAASVNLPLLTAIRQNLFKLGLLERVCHYIDQYRNDNNTILLSDTNSLLREIIADDDAPFVYERVGTWINHYLIDEFQDTSRLQWENLRPLVNEGISRGSDSLIIGDEKQSIYRFRQAEPSLLQRGVKEQMGPKATVRGNTQAENTNWRSSAVVVNFNNEFFERLASATHLGDIYANVRQQIPAKRDPDRGYVEFMQFPALKKEDYQPLVFEQIYQNICRQIDEGYRPSQIAILFRTNKTGHQLIPYLIQRLADDPVHSHVRVVSDDSIRLASSPAVRLIVSIMRFMSTSEGGAPGEDRRKSQLREIRGMINRFEFLNSSDEDPSEALRRALEIQNSDLDIEDQAGTMACFNLPSLVERIVARFVDGKLAESQSMYVAAFIDQVTDYCSRGPADLQGFLKWWDLKSPKLTVAGPVDDNALRIMSIHKSKGLEFGCVHIPVDGWEVFKFSDEEWFPTKGFDLVDPELLPPVLPLAPGDYMNGTAFEARYQQRRYEQVLDETNVLYVGLTRAVDQLSVYYPAPGKDKKNATSEGKKMKMEDIIAPIIDSMAEPEILITDPLDEKSPEIEVRRFGSPTEAEPQKQKKSTAVDPTTTEKMAVYRSFDNDELWNSLDIERYLDFGIARDRGTMLHQVLAQVSDQASLAKAIQNSLRHRIIPEDQAEEIEAHLRQQLDRPEVAPWFSDYSRLLRERSIILENGDKRRPDRVVWTADGHVDIVDYKFGNENPSAYSRQLRRYARAYRAMGFENVRAFIFYVDSGKIVNAEE